MSSRSLAEIRRRIADVCPGDDDLGLPGVAESRRVAAEAFAPHVRDVPDLAVFANEDGEIEFVRQVRGSGRRAVVVVHAEDRFSMCEYRVTDIIRVYRLEASTPGEAAAFLANETSAEAVECQLAALVAHRVSDRVSPSSPNP